MPSRNVGELVYSLEADASGVGSTISRTESSLGGLGKKFRSTGLAGKAAMGVAAAGVAGLGAAVVSGVKKAKRFEQQMSDVRTIIGDNDVAINQLKGGINDMVGEIPQTREDLGASAYKIFSSGITDTSNALKTLEASGKLATAGLSSTEEATNLLTTAIQAFDKNAADATEVANTLFLAVRNGKTTVSQLSQSFGEVASSAGAAGIKLRDVQAATAALTVAGFSTSKAQQRLKTVFLELTETGGTLDKNLRKNGASLAQLKEAVDKNIESGNGFVGGLEEMQDELGLTDKEFRNLFSRSEAGEAVFSLLNSVTGDYKRTLQDTKKDVDALALAFETQADTTENQLIMAQENLNVTLSELGATILPEVNDALQSFNDTMDRLGIGTESAENKIERYSNQLKVLKGFQDDAKDSSIDLTDAQLQNAVAALETKIANEKLKKEQSDLADKVQKTTEKFMDQYTTLGVFTPFLGTVRQGFDFAKRGAKELGFELPKINNPLGIFNQKSKETKEVTKENEDALSSVTEKISKLKEGIKKNNKEKDKDKESWESHGDSVEDAAEKFKDVQKEIGNLTERLRDERAKIQDELEQLNKEFTEKTQELEDELESQFESMAESGAEIVVDAEEKVSEITQEIKEKQEEINKLRAEEDTDQERVKSIQSNIDKLKEEKKEQKDIIESSKGFDERQQERRKKIREELKGLGINAEDIGLGIVSGNLEGKIKEERRKRELNEFEQFERQEVQKLQKIINRFTTEFQLLDEKKEKQKTREEQITKIISDETKKRKKDYKSLIDKIEEWSRSAADAVEELIAKQEEAAGLAEDAGAVSQESKPQFAQGGLVGSRGGEVHPGEYVIPANMVKNMSGLIGGLEGMRTGEVDKSRVFNVEQNFNGSKPDPLEMKMGAREMLWEFDK